MSTDDRPIGVFDSGIGGLTVLRSLALLFPEENFLYLGDTARLPYGSKSAETIRRYTEQNLNWLAQKDCKAVVIACNSASSQFQEKEYKQIPVYNVIDPGARAALEISRSQVIGVLGTRATIESKAYDRKIQELEPKALVFSQTCPLFVPLAEEGWIDDPLTNLIVYRSIQGLAQQPGAQVLDVVILGCTHYPLLREPLQRAVGSGVTLVESGEVLGRQLSEDFRNQIVSVSSRSSGSGKIEVVTTDFSSHFENLARTFLHPVVAEKFSTTDLN